MTRQATRDYPDGIDCVWIASDMSRHVGAFVTGGSGPIPPHVLTAMRPELEEIEELLLALPKCTSATMIVPVKRPDSFIALAERGLFVYDWRDVHRTSGEATSAYEQVAIPQKAALTDTFPAALGDLARQVAMPGIDFVQDKFVRLS